MDKERLFSVVEKCSSFAPLDHVQHLEVQAVL